jgi:RNase adaptor protein for sRNA GlmZ degradation
VAPVSNRDRSPVTVISFGYGHGPAPEAHATFDVRHHFKDPHVRPELRNLTGADAAVVTAVMDTPGVEQLVRSITAAVRAFLEGPQPGPVTVAVGCVGGRHRSAVIADTVASRPPRPGHRRVGDAPRHAPPGHRPRRGRGGAPRATM